MFQEEYQFTTMTDQSIDITSSYNFVRALWDQGEQLDQLSKDADTIEWGTNPGITVLGAVIGTGLLVYVCMMSRNYAAREQRELAEAERIQIARDMEEFKKMEKHRSHISKVVASYAIHLTNITSTLSSSSRHNASAAISPDQSSNNTINSDGTDSDDIPIESITISSSSEDELEDIEESRYDGKDDDDDDESISEHACTRCMTIQSTLTIDAGNLEDDETIQPIPSSSSIASTMTRTKMREAVTYNPCPICLEPFKAGDDVVVCSNNHDGKTPHVFHKTCSLDYILAHPDKIKAPCPMCRNVLVPAEEKQRNEGCFKHSHQSVLTLPDLEQV